MIIMIMIDDLVFAIRVGCRLVRINCTQNRLDKMVDLNSDTDAYDHWTKDKKERGASQLSFDALCVVIGAV